MKDAAKGQVVLASARTFGTVYTSALGYVRVVLMTLPESLVASPQCKVHKSSEDLDYFHYPRLRMEIPHHYCILLGGTHPLFGRFTSRPDCSTCIHNVLVTYMYLEVYVLGPTCPSTGQHMNKYYSGYLSLLSFSPRALPGLLPQTALGP